MITFTVWKSEHQYKGFESKGHADYSIEEFTEDAYQVEQAEDGGYLKVLFPEGLSERAALLMDSLVLGIGNIEAEYGNEYITLLLEEV